MWNKEWTRKNTLKIRRGIRARLKPRVPEALDILAKEYENPDRQKLTHFWLAEKMGLTNAEGFQMLILCSYKSPHLLRFPAGPIYWYNEKITIGQLRELLKD